MNGALRGSKVTLAASPSRAVPKRSNHGVKQKRSFHLSTTVALGQLPLLNRTVLPICSIEVSPHGDVLDEQKGSAAPGLLKAALAGRITNAQGARALGCGHDKIRLAFVPGRIHFFDKTEAIIK
jgi:hypothetical protein